MEEDRCHDYISDIAVDSNGKFLFVTSGDGTMITYNVKRRKFIVQSETADHDMGCVEVMKVSYFISKVGTRYHLIGTSIFLETFSFIFCLIKVKWLLY